MNLNQNSSLQPSHKTLRVALVGSPNSGKTTLFNAMTGSRQKTGNYPGVTVERKEGFISIEERSDGSETLISLLDLPGLYSLNPRTPDEAISAEIIMGKNKTVLKPQLIVAVADSTNLERNLYLVAQLRELGHPMVLALTMNDLARKAKLHIDSKELSRQLGIPVIETAAIKGEGLSDLINEIKGYRHDGSNNEKDAETLPSADKTTALLPDSTDIIQARYRYIETILRASVKKQKSDQSITKAIDKIVLNRIAGPIILFAVFAILFQLIFTGAKVPMEIISEGISQLGTFVKQHFPPGDLTNLIADGIIAGVGAVLVFLPQILILFAFILFFEDSGYMARAAFILDRIMGRFGLNGRAFIPLLSSFACAVPGIMAARTIESRRDRLITILVAPLMTCSARIPIYTLLTAAFIPPLRVFWFFKLPGLVMLALYIFGILTALIVSLVLGRTILKGQTTSFIIELPTYKVPSLKNISLALYDRSRIFLKKAGTTILAISIILWALASFPKNNLATQNTNDPDSNLQASQNLEYSYLGRAGKLIEPVVKPLGYDWKIGIGILSSFAAREVILSTLGTVYAIGSEENDRVALAEQMKASKDPVTGKPVFGLATVLSLLVFYMLACQCISTLAITKRETNSWRWPAFMFVYMTGLAYVLAFATYNLTNFFTRGLY